MEEKKIRMADIVRLGEARKYRTFVNLSLYWYGPFSISWMTALPTLLCNICLYSSLFGDNKTRSSFINPSILGFIPQRSGSFQNLTEGSFGRVLSLPCLIRNFLISSLRNALSLLWRILRLAYFEIGVFWDWRIFRLAYFEIGVFWDWRILRLAYFVECC